MMETMDVMVSKEAMLDTGMLIDDNMNFMENEVKSEKSFFSDTVILTIVIVVCAVAGIVLGVITGKRSANK